VLLQLGLRKAARFICVFCLSNFVVVWETVLRSRKYSLSDIYFHVNNYVLQLLHIIVYNIIINYIILHINVINMELHFLFYRLLRIPRASNINLKYATF